MPPILLQTKARIAIGNRRDKKNDRRLFHHLSFSSKPEIYFAALSNVTSVGMPGFNFPAALSTVNSMA